MTPINLDEINKVVFETPPRQVVTPVYSLDDQLAKFQSRELKLPVKPLENNASSKNISPKLMQKTVTAPLSGYACVMTPLKFSELDSVRSALMDDTNNAELKYRVIHNKIEYLLSEPKMKVDFDNWTLMTCLLDVETLHESMFAMAFPGKNKTSVTCYKNVYVIDNIKHVAVPVENADINTLKTVEGNTPKAETCNKTFDIEMYPEQYRSEVPQVLTDTAETILHTPMDLNAIFDNSIMAKSNKMIRMSNNIFAEYQLPSIARKLKVDKLIADSSRKDVEQITTLVYFIKAIHIPDVEKFNANPTVPLEISTVSDIEQVFGYLDGLMEDDIISILEMIQANTDAYRIIYRTNEGRCPKCGSMLPPLEIRPSELILFRLYDFLERLSNLKK